MPKTLSRYSQQLKKPRWQKIRLKVMERDDWTCRECHRKDVTLNGHHRFYLRGCAPWAYEMDWLETLCENCHEHREKAIVDVHTALLNCSTGELQLWAKRIGREIEAPRRALQAVNKNEDGDRPLTAEEGHAFFQRVREELNAQ